MLMDTAPLRRARTIALVLLVNTACGQYTGSDLCLELDGPCAGQGSGGDGRYATRFYLLGLPAARVDRSATLPNGTYRAILHVGDAFPLQYMIAVGDTTDGAGLPIQGTQWALMDSSAAHITSVANGAGMLTVLAPGVLTTVLVNDVPYHEITSCDAQKQCVRVTELDIVQ